MKFIALALVSAVLVSDAEATFWGSHWQGKKDQPRRRTPPKASCSEGLCRALISLYSRGGVPASSMAAKLPSTCRHCAKVEEAKERQPCTGRCAYLVTYFCRMFGMTPVLAADTVAEARPVECGHCRRTKGKRPSKPCPSVPETTKTATVVVDPVEPEEPLEPLPMPTETVVEPEEPEDPNLVVEPVEPEEPLEPLPMPTETVVEPAEPEDPNLVVEPVEPEEPLPSPTQTLVEPEEPEDPNLVVEPVETVTSTTEEKGWDVKEKVTDAFAQWREHFAKKWRKGSWTTWPAEKWY